jgi:hypothetical protein
MPSTLAGLVSMLTWRCRPSASASVLARRSRSFSAQREVEEVAAAAGGVEHAEIAQAFEVAVEQRGGVLGLVLLLFRFLQCGGDGGFRRLPIRRVSGSRR